MVERAVGVRKRLKIGQIAGCSAVASRVELDALLNLLRDALHSLAVGGGKCLIITESTATHTYPSITIWAGKACIYRHLLHPLAKAGAEVGRVAVVGSVVAPRIHSVFKVFIHCKVKNYFHSSLIFLLKIALYLQHSNIITIFARGIHKSEITMEKCLELKYIHAESIDALSAADRELIAEAQKATEKAYAAYSNFRVGAAVRLRSGKIMHGANSESEVFPSGLCAERSVLYYVEANHADDPVEALAIASNPSERECYPCGGCRQVILDVERRQGSPIRVIMSGNGTASIVESAELLLPFTFKL